MDTSIWIITLIALGGLAVGVARAARRRRRLVPAGPATISVSEPTVDVLESPRHAAEARAEAAHLSAGGVRRRYP
jgi:hypothetical protein